MLLLLLREMFVVLLLLLLLPLLGCVEEGTEGSHAGICPDHLIGKEGLFLFALGTAAAVARFCCCGCCCCCCCCLVVVFFPSPVSALGLGGGKRGTDDLCQVRGWSEAWREGKGREGRWGGDERRRERTRNIA